MGRVEDAIDALKREYPTLDFTYRDFPLGEPGEKMFTWPGPPDEDVMIVVHQCSGVRELFHRHDFFYFNYTYRGSYESLSQRYDNVVTIREGELYAGQPSAGHALLVHDDVDTVIIGMLVRKEAFFRSFLPMLSSDSSFLRFLLDPAADCFADEFIHFELEDQCTTRALFEMMAVEYAGRREDTQDVLKPLALALLMQVARQYVDDERAGAAPAGAAERMVRYLGEHVDTATLGSLAARFSYHPNYVSTLLRQETGKSFSELLLEQRMERAAILLRGTDLPVAEVARTLGYLNTSNFHKAFRAYYGTSPRAFGADGGGGTAG